MKSIISILAFLIFFISASQSPQLDWVKGTGGAGFDGASNLALDPSGNIGVVGYFQDTVEFNTAPASTILSSNGGSDIFIKKLDSQGNLLWALAEGGKGFDQGGDLEFDQSGNLYLTGIFQDTVDFDPGVASQNIGSNGNFDIFIQKFDVYGNLLWVRTMGSAQGDNGIALNLTPAGNVLLTGVFSDSVDFDPGPAIYKLKSSGNRDAFLLQLDAQGDFIWARSLGGIAADQANVAFTDPSGNIYWGGLYQGTVDLDPGVAALPYTSAGSDDIYFMKMDSSGNLIWVKSIGGALSDRVYSAAINDSGEVFLTGSYQGVVDFDPGAGSFLLQNTGDPDVFLLKLDKQGNFVWAKSYGGSSWDAAASLYLDPAENIYVSGIFEDSADFDPGPNVVQVFSNGGFDAFTLKLDSNGDFVWVATAGGAGYDAANAIVSGSLGLTYVAGEFESTADFDPDSGIVNLSAAGENDIFVQKIRESTFSIYEIQKPGLFGLYPNPGTGEFYLDLPQDSPAIVKLYNPEGKLVAERTVIDFREPVALNLDPGIYTLEVIYEGQRFYKKLIMR